MCSNLVRAFLGLGRPGGLSGTQGVGWNRSSVQFRMEMNWASRIGRHVYTGVGVGVGGGEGNE